MRDQLIVYKCCSVEGVLQTLKTLNCVKVRKQKLYFSYVECTKYLLSAHPLCVRAQLHLLELQVITCSPFMPLTMLVNSTTQCSLHLEIFSSHNSPNAYFTVIVGVSGFLSSLQISPPLPSHLASN